MRAQILRRFLVGFMAACAASWSASGARAQIDQEQVRASIEQGVDYLKREQREDGSWPDPASFAGGITALCTLAQLNAGVTPDDPQLKAALNYLRKLPPRMTYCVALQTMVFCAAEPKSSLSLVRRNVLWLQENQIREGDRRGSWGYPLADGDNSNTQFAILALHEAERIGVPVNDQTWRLALDYWVSNQNLDGSWGYHPGNSGTGSMTCAGIAAVIIAADKLVAADAQVEGDLVRCCRPQQETSAIQNGLNWMARNFSVHSNPGGGQTWLLYYLYGLERVGRLTNQRMIGNSDWYREGADLLVKAQDDLSGYWKGVGHAEDDPHVATSLALLFLAKGRRPVIAAKLKHEPLDDWNHHRNDLANLVTYVERRWQRDLTWQIIDAAVASPDDLAEAPVQFISGQLDPEFTQEQVQNLRAYVDRGGFIFAESCCGGDDFDRGFRALVKRLFPEPEYELHLLPPEHPVYGAEERVDPEHLRPLYGVDIGCRTSLVYSPQNLSCYWEVARPGRERKLGAKVQGQVDAALAIGTNVLAYATNREVKYKLDISLAPEDGGPSDPSERARVYIAKIQHGGGWNAAPGALINLMKTVARETGVRMDTDRLELTLSNPELFKYHMVFMHGRNAFRLSDSDRKQLRTYLERGGVLMVDAICGSAEFARSVRRELAAIFPDNALEPIPAAHPLFTVEYGGFDLSLVNRREPRRRQEDGTLQSTVRRVPPELEGIQLDKRYAVIFSPYDISCALERHDSLECAGYTREDAARIGLNVVLYSLHQ